MAHMHCQRKMALCGRCTSSGEAKSIRRWWCDSHSLYLVSLPSSTVRFLRAPFPPSRVVSPFLLWQTRLPRFPVNVLISGGLPCDGSVGVVNLVRLVRIISMASMTYAFIIDLLCALISSVLWQGFTCTHSVCVCVCIPCCNSIATDSTNVSAIVSLSFW